MNIHKNESRYHIIVAVFSLATLITIGTIIFHILEDWNLAQSFYFSVATLTTVGYGDLHPTTDIARIIVAIYILLGVGVTLASITVIATDRINKTAGKIRKYSKTKKELDKE